MWDFDPNVRKIQSITVSISAEEVLAQIPNFGRTLLDRHLAISLISNLFFNLFGLLISTRIFSPHKLTKNDVKEINFIKSANFSVAEICLQDCTRF